MRERSILRRLASICPRGPEGIVLDHLGCAYLPCRLLPMPRSLNHQCHASDALTP